MFLCHLNRIINILKTNLCFLIPSFKVHSASSCPPCQELEDRDRDRSSHERIEIQLDRNYHAVLIRKPKDFIYGTELTLMLLLYLYHTKATA